jgi:hypothetical protein
MLKPFPLLAIAFIIAACQPLPTTDALPEMVKVKVYTEFCPKGKNNYVEISNLAGVENQPLLAKIKTAVDNSYFEGAKPNDINAYFRQVCAGKIADKKIKEANIYHNKNGLLSIQTDIHAEIFLEEWATYDLYKGELIMLNSQINPEKLASLDNFILQNIPNIKEIQNVQPNFNPKLSGRFYLRNETELVLEWIADKTQLGENFCTDYKCGGEVAIPKVVLKDFIIETSPLRRFIE